MSGRAATDTVVPGRHALSVGDPQTETPVGWSWLPLGELATMGTGHTPSRGVSAYWDGDVQWMGIRDARAHHGGQIWNTAQTITQAGLDNSSARLLPAGTVALSRTASVGYVVQLGREMATSQDFVTWTCSAALDPLFLMRTIQAEGEDIRKFGEGSTHTTIYFPELKALHVKTPPVPEQRRIVAKIDRLSARSERAREELEQSQTLIATFKKKLLRSIFIPLQNECSSQLVELSDVCTKVQSGGTPKAGFRTEGVPFLKVYNIVDNEVNFTYKSQFISRDTHFSDSKKSICQKGDVLMNIVGPPLGKIAIVPATLGECNINQAICLFRPGERLDKRFLYYFLLSGISIDSIFGQTKGIVGQVNISLSQCRAFRIPLINRDLQNEIVRRIEHAFAAIDRLAAEAASAQKLLDRLDQAVLAKAFRGELVQQDPNDEPASVLLERIRAERAAAPASKRGRRPKAAAG